MILKKIKQVNGLFMSINTSKYQDFESQGYKKIFGNTKEEFICDGKKYIMSVKTTLPDHLESFEIRNKIVKTMVKGSKKIISINCENGILEMNLDQEVVAIDEKKDNIESATYNAKLLGKENINLFMVNQLKKWLLLQKRKCMIQ